MVLPSMKLILVKARQSVVNIVHDGEESNLQNIKLNQYYIYIMMMIDTWMMMLSSALAVHNMLLISINIIFSTK